MSLILNSLAQVAKTLSSGFQGPACSDKVKKHNKDDYMFSFLLLPIFLLPYFQKLNPSFFLFHTGFPREETQIWSEEDESIHYQSYFHLCNLPIFQLTFLLSKSGKKNPCTAQQQHLHSMYLCIWLLLKLRIHALQNNSTCTTYLLI